jgi:hypothetical protein
MSCLPPHPNRIATPISQAGSAKMNIWKRKLGDLRFRALMSDLEWASLPQPIRRRFSKRLSGGRTVVYVGEVVETRLSLAGHLLAQAARLIGFIDLPGHRLWLPDVMTTGALTVTHTEFSDGRFSFTLNVTHARFGLLIHQRAVFRQIEP